MKAILLVSHGSRSPRTKEEVLQLVGKLKQLCPLDIVEYAFLEIEVPGIPDGIDQCIAQGASQVAVVLNFLNAGRHVDEDIPLIVRNAQAKYPFARILMTKPIGQHPSIPNLFVDLINGL